MTIHRLRPGETSATCSMTQRTANGLCDHDVAELQLLVVRGEEYQRRLDEALAVLGDRNEERGLADFREWLEEQERKTRRAGNESAAGGTYLSGEATGYKHALAELDRRFPGVKK